MFVTPAQYSFKFPAFDRDLGFDRSMLAVFHLNVQRQQSYIWAVLTLVVLLFCQCHNVFKSFPNRNKLKALLKTNCNVIKMLQINFENTFFKYSVDLCIMVGSESTEVLLFMGERSIETDISNWFGGLNCLKGGYNKNRER